MELTEIYYTREREREREGGSDKESEQWTECEKNVREEHCECYQKRNGEGWVERERERERINEFVL